VSGQSIAAIAAGGAAFAFVVGYYLVAHRRRGTLWTREVARFLVGMIILYLVLVATFAAGGAWAIVIPPGLLLAAGIYLVTFGSRSIGAGMTARTFGIYLAVVGAVGLGLAFMRVAL
jgi:hypothetical protein